MNFRACSTALVLAFLMASPLFAETARVVTRENAIRESCRFFAPVKAKVRYNDAVAILSREGDWYRVRFKGTTGCIHKSALEEKKFSLSGLRGSKPSAASQDEVALAGKGFNPQVEKSYRGKNPDLDFRAVDLIEAYDVPDSKLMEFMKEGGLSLAP
ncbi:MAG: hypothetical protein ACM34I_09080 [bacterium]